MLHPGNVIAQLKDAGKRNIKTRSPTSLSFESLAHLLDGGFEAWEETIVSIASAVNWPMAVMGLKQLGNDFFECGFGSQLKNLTGWIDRDLKVESLQAPRMW